MNSLPKDQRPKSDDPDFWAVWSGEGLDEDERGQKVERSVDWQEIAADWQQAGVGEANETPLVEAEDADAAADDNDIPF